MTRQVRKEEGEEEEKMTTKKEMFTVKENEAIERENFRSGREERPIRSKENSRKGYVGVKRLCYRCVCVCVKTRVCVQDQCFRVLIKSQLESQFNDGWNHRTHFLAWDD